MRPPFDQGLLAGLRRKDRDVDTIVIDDYGRDLEKLVGNPEWGEETGVNDNVA